MVILRSIYPKNQIPVLLFIIVFLKKMIISDDYFKIFSHVIIYPSDHYAQSVSRKIRLGTDRLKQIPGRVYYMESLDLWNELVSFVSRHQIISLLWVITLGYVIYYQTIIWKDGLKLLNSRDAVDMYNHDLAALVDVRTTEEFMKGHLAGAVSVSSEDLLGQKFSQVERFKDKTIVVIGKGYDDVTAYKCAKNLKKKGYKSMILNGGMQEWTINNYPVVKG